MTLHGILFDKDGTLTDFHKTWMPAYGAAAALIEVWCDGRVAADELLRVGGFDSSTGRCSAASALACGSGREIAELWGFHTRIDSGRVLAGIEDKFAEHAASNPVPAGDLVALFSRLKRRGLTLGVATMDSEALAHQTLERLDIAQFFSFVCGYDSGFGEKPGAGMVHGYCAAVDLEPSQIAVVGDTPHDLNMARAAGTQLAIGVLTGASEHVVLASLSRPCVGGHR